jgi:hypothetical protein
MSVRLYAVLRLRRGQVALPMGLNGERIRTMESAGLTLAVADLRRPLEPSVGEILQFDRVIGELADISDAILPARFNAVASGRAALRREITGRAEALASALTHVRHCVQMTVRIRNSGRTRKGTIAARRQTAGATYLRARAAAANPAALAALRKSVATIVRDEHIQTEDGGVTVHHLVRKRDLKLYIRRAKGVQVSGPFPPYAFASGIDHAALREHEEEANTSLISRSARSRAHRRSSRNSD